MAFGDARANFATSTVATAPSPATSGTSLVVAAGEGARFPATSFNAVIAPAAAIPTPTNAEVVRVTARATDTLTITRAQESSSARTVIVGDRIYAGPTAGDQALIETNHAVTGSITTIQPDDAAAGGSATTWARGDHKHAIVTATAGTLAGTAAEGSATSFARSDHDHGLPDMGTIFTNLGHQSGSLTVVANGANTWHALRILIPTKATLSGIVYQVGTSAGNVRSALYDAAGTTRVAVRTAALAVSANSTQQLVLFDSGYVAAPGYYYGLIWFSSATCTVVGYGQVGAHYSTGTQSGATPTSIGSPSFTTATIPVIATA